MNEYNLDIEAMDIEDIQDAEYNPDAEVIFLEDRLVLPPGYYN